MSLLKKIYLLFLIQFISSCGKPSDGKIPHRDALSGRWICDSVVKSLDFFDDKVVVTDFMGQETNTIFTKAENKLLLNTGDVLTLKNDSTILFPIIVPQFLSKIDCECLKVKR